MAVTLAVNPSEPRLGTTTTAVPGTGLGLYIVRNLVEAMGVTVTARNENRGSTFTIRLPAAP